MSGDPHDSAGLASYRRAQMPLGPRMLTTTTWGTLGTRRTGTSHVKSRGLSGVPSTYSSDRLTPRVAGIRDEAHPRAGPPLPCPGSVAA